MTKPARIDAAAHWVINVRKPMIPIYTLPRVPGAADTTEWTDFCHTKGRFIVIDWHRFTKDYSAKRKRRFCVTSYCRGSFTGALVGVESWFSTLAAAQASAAKQAKALAP